MCGGGGGEHEGLRQEKEARGGQVNEVSLSFRVVISLLIITLKLSPVLTKRSFY